MEVNKINLKCCDKDYLNNDLMQNNFGMYHDKCCYNGGGIELNNNSVYKTIICDGVLYANDNSVNDKMQGASRPVRNHLHEHKQWYDRQNMSKIYSKDGIHSYNLYIDWRGEHSSDRDEYGRHGHGKKFLCTY